MGDHVIRTDHQHYVDVVVRELDETGLPNEGYAITGRPPAVRTATVSLTPPEEGPFADDEQGLELVWDEAYGWVLRLPAEAGTSDWFMGTDLVPSPESVARWADMVLHHPHLAPSRDDGPTRLPDSDDPAFEERLAAYAVSA